MSQKEQINFEINSEFFEQLHNLMQWKGREPETLLHIRNALELYTSVIEGMAEGKIPVMVKPNGKDAEKVQLPTLLAQFRHEKEIELDREITLLKKIL